MSLFQNTECGKAGTLAHNCASKLLVGLNLEIMKKSKIWSWFAVHWSFIFWKMVLLTDGTGGVL